MIFNEFLSRVGIAKVSRIKWTLIFFQSVNFSSSYGNLSFKKHEVFGKKIEFLFFFSKNNDFGKKLSTEPQSLFERASLTYFLFFNFPILKSDVWHYRLDNTYTRFRALDRFCFPDPQLWAALELRAAVRKTLKLRAAVTFGKPARAFSHPRDEILSEPGPPRVRTPISGV